MSNRLEENEALELPFAASSTKMHSTALMQSTQLMNPLSNSTMQMDNSIYYTPMSNTLDPVSEPLIQEKQNISSIQAFHTNQSRGSLPPTSQSHSFTPQTFALHSFTPQFTPHSTSQTGQFNHHSSQLKHQINPPQMEKHSIYSQNAKLNTKNSLYQDLLPNTVEWKPTNTYHDLIFALIFIIGFVIMIVLGIIYTFTAQPFIKGNNMFQTLDQNAGYLSWMVIFSSCLGFIWIFLLRRFIRTAMWFTVFLVPIGFLCLSIWSFASVLLDSTMKSRWLIPQALASFLASVFATTLIIRNRAHIKRSVDLVELAVQILRENPSIWGVTGMILISYSLFAITWVALFARLMLQGHAEPVQLGGMQWIPDPSSTYTMTFFLFMFIWTSAVFSYIERLTISGVVCQWYFHRNDPVRIKSKTDVAMEVFSRSITFNFGSICFAAIVISLVQGTKMIIRFLKKICRLGNNSWIQWLLSWFNFIEGFIECINTYALVYIAYSGTDFITAAKSSSALFQRNLLDALVMDNLAKLILMMSVYVFSSISFISTFNHSLMTSASSYAYLVAVIGTIIPFFMVRFVAYVLLQVIDATYVCYVIDLDKKEVSHARVHKMFGNENRDDIDLQETNA